MDKIGINKKDKDNLKMNRLKSIFKVGFKSKDNAPINQQVQTYKVVDKKIDNAIHPFLVSETFPEDVKQLLNYWMVDCHDTMKSWQNRVDLFQDMEMVYINSPLISRAIELTADEAIQADSNNQPIFVEAKPQIKQTILDFLDKININELLRPTIVDIILYGNAGWLLSLDDSGVNEVVPVEVYDIKDRLQFTPYEVKQKMQGQNNIYAQFKSIDRMNQLIQSIEDNVDDVTRFKTYLFGFQIGDYVVPPWRFIHFRNATNKSAIKPFGIPVFIHSISPYRQYDASMTLNVIARGASVPRSVYKLKFPNTVDPTDKVNRAVDFMRELQNAGLGNTKKEDMGVGETIITIDDLYTYETESVDAKGDSIADIELLRDDLIISTMVPRSLIDPTDGGFGVSGVSLIEQFKPFARMIYRIQSIFLHNLSQLLKIHLIQTGNFALEDIDFVLSMPYPESQTNSDIIASQSSLVTLAGDIISSLEDKIMGGEKLPVEVMKSIYQKFLPYDDATIEKWLDLPEVSPNSNISDDDEAEEKKKSNKKFKIVDSDETIKNWRLLEKKYTKIKLKEAIEEIVLEEKQKTLREGVIKKRHYYSSRIKDVDFPAEKLRELEIDRIKRMSEDKENKEDYGIIKEEVYVFKSDFQDIQEINESNIYNTYLEEGEDYE